MILMSVYVETFCLHVLGYLRGCCEEMRYWHGVEQCFSDWVLRKPRVPQNGVRGSERRKSIMAEEFFWRSLNFYVRIKIRVATLDPNQVADSTQSVNRCFSSEASRFCSPVSQRRSPWTVDVSGETIRWSISLWLAVDFFLHVMYTEVKQTLVFNFILIVEK
jgi:hypothetical protein